jgi:hypothetical protein
MAEDHNRAGRYVSRLLFLAARRRWRELRSLAAGVSALDRQTGGVLAKKIRWALPFEGVYYCVRLRTPENGTDTMATKRMTRLTATAALRQALSECGLNFLELQRRSGVPRQSVMKFVRREQTLRLDLADKLMKCLGVQVQLGPVPPVPKARKPRPEDETRQGVRTIT